MTETKRSNTPMILGIVGFVSSIPGILCTGMCAGLAEAGGAKGAGTTFLYLSLVPSILGFIFSFMANSKAKLAGIVLIVCSVLLLITTVITFNWFFGLITTASYLIAGVLSVKNQ